MNNASEISWILRYVDDAIRAAFLRYQHGEGQGPTAAGSAAAAQANYRVTRHALSLTAHNAPNSDVMGMSARNLSNSSNFH